MNTKIPWLALIVGALLLSSCTLPQAASPSPVTGNLEFTPTDIQPTTAGNSQLVSRTPAGGQLTTYVESAGIGDIAVQVTLPEQPRYPEGAGIVIEVNTFLTPKNGFYSSLDVPAVGLIHVTYLWPGITAASGAHSDGNFDFGGELSIQALRDVIGFASGQVPNYEGYYLNELISISPLFENVGLYAFSHPGQAAVNVLSIYGDQLSNLSYFIGRENPTLDKLTAVELGYFSAQNRPELNPLYRYPGSYQPTGISIDYGSIAWDAAYSGEGSKWAGRPYFDINGNGVIDNGDHLLGPQVPALDGKRLYSVDLVSALVNNNAIPAGEWPSDLATLEEVSRYWPYQNSTQRYPTIGSQLPNLKVMLVFARYDHVQPAADKPHIHQAFDGFRRGAGLWVRLNPDLEYIASINPNFASSYQENSANQAPVNWLDAEEWGYANRPGAAQFVPLAALAEMSDRVYGDVWDEDLNELVYSD